MSVLSQILSYGKEVILLTERVDKLLEDRTALITKLEDHEHRLVRIETIMEFAQRQRRVSRD
ncbi:MAG TPA: hypothetical protein VII17_02235 [Steroidobacteraceae bacterium]|jgi:hypothetical protein